MKSDLLIPLQGHCVSFYSATKSIRNIFILLCLATFELLVRFLEI